MIDIVTLTWNRPNYLRNCLDSILKFSEGNVNKIFVVINEYNNSYDFLDDYEDANLEVIKLTTNEGVVARNHALKQCTSEYVAQIDDDVCVQEGWESKVLSMLVDDVKGVGPQGGWVLSDLSNYFTPNATPSIGQYTDVLTGFFWVFKNNKFLYDETFGMHWHEETDLQFQMREAGYRFKICDTVCIHHHAQKQNHWMEYHDPNVKKVQDKWLHKKEELHFEKHNTY